MRNSTTAIAEKLDIAQERFFRFMVDGHRDISEKEAYCRMEKLGISGWGPFFCVAEVSLHLDLYPVDKVDGILLQIEESVRQYLCRLDWRVSSYIDSRNCMILIISFDSRLAYDNLDILLAKFVDKVMSDYGIVIYAGIGGIVSKVTDIKHSAKDASTCVAYKYSVAGQNVINIKDIKRIQANTTADHSTAFDRVIGCFMDGDLKRLQVRLEELLSLFSGASSKLQQIKQVYLELVVKVVNRAADVGIFLEGEETSVYLQYILSEDDQARLKAWFIERCTVFVQEMSRKRQESTSNIARIAKEYVERNYSDPNLSQQSVCDYLNLSVGYFGQLFFSQTGQRFVDYLHEYRLQVAQERLLTTNDKVKAISITTGFNSVNYFNSLFKKHFGVTPKEYRTQHN